MSPAAASICLVTILHFEHNRSSTASMPTSEHLALPALPKSWSNWIPLISEGFSKAYAAEKTSDKWTRKVPGIFFSTSTNVSLQCLVRYNLRHNFSSVCLRIRCHAQEDFPGKGTGGYFAGRCLNGSLKAKMLAVDASHHLRIIFIESLLNLWF